MIFGVWGVGLKIDDFRRGSLEGPRLRELGQGVVKGSSVGALQSSTVSLRLQDTGYNLQDTGIEGCKCNDFR